MLFQAAGKIKQTTIMISIVLIAAGVVMLLCPTDYVRSLVALAGYALLILASVMVFDFIGSERQISDYISFSVALFLLLIGIAVLVFNDDLLFVLSNIFGVLLVLDGVHSLIYSIIFSRRAGSKGWPVLLILSIFLIAVGLVVVINPWWTTDTELLRVIGWALLFAALVAVCRVLITWPIKKEKGGEV